MYELAIQLWFGVRSIYISLGVPQYNIVLKSYVPSSLFEKYLLVSSVSQISPYRFSFKE